MRLLLAFASGLVAIEAAQQYGAIPIAPDGLMPRYILDKSVPLAKRDGKCGEGSHDCLDIGHGESCCENDTYCFVNKEGVPNCCPIGSDCSGQSPCNSTAFFCTSTQTASGTTAAEEGCCNRKCPQESHYLCPSSLGGKCCQYGFECRSGGDCVQAKTESRPPKLTPIEEGCTTSQHKCTQGTGCCNNWQHCTEVSGTDYCAAGNPTDTTITVSEQPSSDPGLSDGAKAGIAVGAVVGSGLSIGALVWLCLTKRRQQRSVDRPSGVGPQVRDGETTEVSGSQVHPPSNSGLTQDYFGPNATPGPYTETAVSTTTSPGPGRAVPSTPQAPGDIAAPVEIDSHSKTGDDGLLSSLSNPSICHTPRSETIGGRYELYAAPPPDSPAPTPTPTPLSPRSERDRPPES